jgi:hypothetical protein
MPRDCTESPRRFRTDVQSQFPILASHTNMKQNKQTKRQQQPAAQRSGWANVLRLPFHHASCHIPDDRTMVSGTVSSRQFLSFTPTMLAGTSSTHQGGMMFYPHPAYTMFEINEATAGGTISALLANGDFTITPSVANIASIVPANSSSTMRLVSMGLRLTYEGTELNRAGKIFAGTVPITFPSTTTTKGSTPFHFEPLSPLLGTATPTSSQLKNAIQLLSTSRVTDREFEINWVPSGVPTYQAVSNASGIYTESLSTSATVNSNNVFTTAPGGLGSQTGQNVLMFWIEGDTTTTAAADGNTYNLEVIWHWEVIPSSPLSVAYDLTHSPSNFPELQAALNTMGSYGRGVTSAVTSNALQTTGGMGRVARAVKAVRSSPVAKTLANQAYNYGAQFVSAATQRAIQSAVRAAAPAIMARAGGRRPRAILPA